MSDTQQSRCRILRTGVVNSVDCSFVHAEVEGKRIAIPIGKCEPSVRTGDTIAWNGKQWTVSDSDVSS
ncbi:hypothetical protein [Cohnella panacarvi]|uniref:hypothetical protein n=1 Tax=Cohnella panacarvi TaxID=400776 RepID=UPI00047EAD6C|nr:hypothetical protein [Cohnella panacarvi]